MHGVLISLTLPPFGPAPPLPTLPRPRAHFAMQGVQEKLALDKSYYGKLLARERGAGPIGALGAMEGDYAAGGMFGA